MPKHNNKKVRVTIQAGKSSNQPRKSKKRSSVASIERRLQTALVLSGSQMVRSQHRSIPRSMPFSKAQRRYLLAIENPFHPDAVGATVPDFCTQTLQPFTVRWRAIFSASSPGATNNVTFMGFVPNPAIYGYAFTGPGTTTTLTNLAISPFEGSLYYVSSNSQPGWPGALVDSQTTNAPLFSTYYSTFRVVGGGVRLSNLTSIAQNQFMLNTYSLPAIQNNVPYIMMNGTDAPANPANSTSYVYGGMNGGLTSQAFFGQNVVSQTQVTNGILQSRRAYTSYEIQDGPLVLAFRPNNPIAHVLRESAGTPIRTNTSSSQGAAFGNVTFVSYASTGAGLQSESYDSDISNNEGWNGVAITLVPPTSTTSVVNSFSVEFLLHCEGVPQAQTTGFGSAPASSSDTSRPNGWGIDSLVKLAYDSYDYAKQHPQVVNGMADALRHAAYNFNRYERTVNGRLRLQNSEF